VSSPRWSMLAGLGLVARPKLTAHKIEQHPPRERWSGTSPRRDKRVEQSPTESPRSSRRAAWCPRTDPRPRGFRTNSGNKFEESRSLRPEESRSDLLEISVGSDDVRRSLGGQLLPVVRLFSTINDRKYGGRHRTRIGGRIRFSLGIVSTLRGIAPTRFPPISGKWGRRSEHSRRFYRAVLRLGEMASRSVTRIQAPPSGLFSAMTVPP
jgi:hypothetical protein